MTVPVTIRRVEGTLSVSISEFATEMGVGEGDRLLVRRTAVGIELTPSKATDKVAIEAARGFMERYPKAMKKLAE